MDKVQIPRRDDRVLVFTGEKIGEASSACDGRDRWSEAFVYRTSTGKYVVGGVGRSTVPGEEDWWWAHVVDTAIDAVEKMYRRNSSGTKYLTIVAEEALVDASRNDPAFIDAIEHEYV